MGKIQCLNASSRRNVIFGGGYLQLAVVAEGTGDLNQSLSVGALAHNYAPVQILDCSGDNFRGRG